MTTTFPAILALADGSIFKARGFGAHKTLENASIGELVFNTSMFGYQEILTDPSYAGQTIVFTSPHIGNVGCNAEDTESLKIHATGVIIRDLSPIQSNFRAELSFTRYLEEGGIMGICNIDTRALVTRIRENGAQMVAMAGGDNINPSSLVDLARANGSMLGKDYVKAVSCKEPYSWNKLPYCLTTYCLTTYSLTTPNSLTPGSSSGGGVTCLSEEVLAGRPHVVVLDCGVKENILRLLVEVGFRVTVVPATHSPSKILELKPDCMLLSNGPGDPAALDYVVKSVKEIFGKLPIFGICLGHQILAQVCGGKTFKLKFGHRGGNHPVKDLTTEKVEITVQNHGFAVEPRGLPSEAKISHINLNDQTIEGLEVPSAMAFSIQYHPEASPGPHDAKYLFKRFFEMVVSS